MSETKPTNVGAWATDDQVDPTSGEDNVAEPGASRKQSGWDRHDPVFRQWLNWLGRIGWQWRKWLDERLFDGATTADFTIRAPDTEGGDVKLLGGTTDGTANQNGGDVIIAGGDSTGTGYSDVILSAAVAGAGGTDARVAEEFLRLDGAGGFIDISKAIDSSADIETTQEISASIVRGSTAVYTPTLASELTDTVTVNDILAVDTIEAATSAGTVTVDSPLVADSVSTLSGNPAVGSLATEDLFTAEYPAIYLVTIASEIYADTRGTAVFYCGGASVYYVTALEEAVGSWSNSGLTLRWTNQREETVDFIWSAIRLY